MKTENNSSSSGKLVCIRCPDTTSEHWIEIIPGRTLCSDCAIYSNEGYYIETGVPVTCALCEKRTNVGEEYIESSEGGFVCVRCTTSLSEKLEALFQDDSFNPPVAEDMNLPECALPECHVKELPGGKKLLNCGGCKVTLYCCSEHQKGDRSL